MSNYFERYKNRLGSSGKDVGEVYYNNTVHFMNLTFHASPTYRVMEISSTMYPDIKEMDARVVEIERLGTLREIILRPQANLEIGMNAKIDDEWYMLIDKYGGTGSTSVKLLAIKINDSMTWRTKEQSDYWSKNKDNEEYIDTDFTSFMCVASATDLGSKAKQSKNEIEWNKYDVRLPIGQLFITAEKNSMTSTIGLNHRFVFGRNVYEVTGIDDITNTSIQDGVSYGLIQFTVKITTVHPLDDIENGIAYNSYKEDFEDNGNGDDSDEGGGIW